MRGVWRTRAAWGGLAGSPSGWCGGVAVFPTDTDALDANRKKLSFLQKLLHIMATTESDVMSWSASGESFFVYDVDRYVGLGGVPSVGRVRIARLLCVGVCVV